jgi:hypothetical protein
LPKPYNGRRSKSPHGGSPPHTIHTKKYFVH